MSFEIPIPPSGEPEWPYDLYQLLRKERPDYLTDCIVLERLSPIGRELIPVLYEKNYLGTAVRNFYVIKIYPNSSILPKYFCLDTPQNKALLLNQ